MMRIKTLGLTTMAAAVALSLGGCAGGYGSDYRDSYGAAPGSPYYAEQYYRDEPNYRERQLRRSDRVYVGRDGRYYCKRSDGTTGLIVGGIAGGALGNIIAPGGSKTLGTLLGAAGGAAIGASVDKKDVRCR